MLMTHTDLLHGEQEFRTNAELVRYLKTRVHEWRISMNLVFSEVQRARYLGWAQALEEVITILESGEE